MKTKLKATITRKTPKGVQLEISRESFEAFCNSVGLYRKEFLKVLDLSEEDHKKGRVTKRKSLSELVEDK